MLGRSLAGRTLGLVGFGRIARATAERARSALGMNIAYHSRSRADLAAETALGARHVETLEQLAAEADILSLHCPGGPATRHLVDARLLSRMKREAILINTARGSIVDEVALAAALRDGVIGGAGLDVYEGEPELKAPLRVAPNTVLLPHLGSATVETRTAMGRRVATNIEAFLSGKEPPDRVA